MTEHNKDNDMTISSAPSLTVGDRLKEARESKKLSEQDVASELRVSKNIVIYLERQQWDALPTRTYARGYFINYVKLLGLPSEEMLALFNLEYQSSEGHRSHKMLDDVSDSSSLPWLGVIGIMVVILTIWFAYQHWHNDMPFITSDQINETAMPTQGTDESLKEQDIAPVEFE